jgi:plastocyanin
MTDLWNTIVNQYIGRLVSPDWGTLVLLIPLGLLLVVVLYLGWILVRFATAGPRTRGGPVVAIAPAGVHMPGPSLSPLYLAGSVTVLFLGLAAMNADPKVLVAGSVPLRDIGPAIFALGALLTLGAGIHWLREVMLESARPAGRGLVAAGEDDRHPPAGVHVPGPSFRPLLLAIAAAVLILGQGLATNAKLVKDVGNVGTPILIAGVVMFVIVALQWLRDAVIEYRLTVRADRTGHLDNPPAPRFPWATLGIFAGLLVVAVVVGTGTFPPKAGGGAPTVSAAPGGGGSPASAAPGGAASAAPGGGASAAPGGAGGSGPSIALVASGIAYDQADLTAPAGTAFTIAFDNQDAGIPHNVSIHEGSATGTAVFTGDIVTGVAQKAYAVPALKAGTYAFVCSVHPNMVGTLTVK